MLQLEPARWFSWAFTVAADGKPLGTLDISAWRERGDLTMTGRTFTIVREGFLSGGFRLESDGTSVATASRPRTMWPRRATATLPDTLPLPVRLFVLWLGMLIWKRDDDAAATAATG